MPLLLVLLVGLVVPYAAAQPATAYLDTLGVTVPAEENRIFSYTDKRDAYFFGRTHENVLDDGFAHFLGWNARRERVLQDYTLLVDGRALDRRRADVTVYPDRLERRFARAHERLQLYDGVPVLGLLLSGVEGETVGVTLHGEQIAFVRVEGGLAYFTPLEAPGRVVAVGAATGGALAVRRDTVVTAPAGAGGFFVALGDDAAEAAARVGEARAMHERWAEARAERMAALVTEANPLASADTALVRSLHWNMLTLDQLVTEQTGHGIYAGLPWFNDYWGRDIFISLPGAALVTGQFDVARDVLQSFARYQMTDPDSVHYGRVPNRLRPDDVIYNTTDGTPRFVDALHDYVRYTGDTALVRELYPAVRRSIEGPMRYWMDEHGYLRHDDADTWMDAKLDGHPWSPRGTRANDIQALWHAQLTAGARFARLLGHDEDARRWQRVADRVERRFREDFFDAEHAPLMADRLTAEGRADFSVRPNQLFAMDLMEDDALRRARLARTAWERLVYPWGVASLWQMDDAFHPYHHADDCYYFDSAYHNGTVWVWNNGIAMQRMIEAGQPEVAYRLFDNMTRQTLREGAVGSLAENMDALPRPGEDWAAHTGTFLQAWSNAEYLRVWYQHFLGLRPDALEGTLTLAPRLPAAVDTLRYGAELLGGALGATFGREGDAERHTYRFENLATEVRIDLPRFAPVEVAVESGDRLEVVTGDDALSVRRRDADGRLLAETTRRPDPEAVARHERLDALFEDVGFAEPSLRDDLPALRDCTP